MGYYGAIKGRIKYTNLKTAHDALSDAVEDGWLQRSTNNKNIIAYDTHDEETFLEISDNGFVSIPFINGRKIDKMLAKLITANTEEFLFAIAYEDYELSYMIKENSETDPYMSPSIDKFSYEFRYIYQNVIENGEISDDDIDSEPAFFFDMFSDLLENISDYEDYFKNIEKNYKNLNKLNTICDDNNWKTLIAPFMENIMKQKGKEVENIFDLIAKNIYSDIQKIDNDKEKYEKIKTLKLLKNIMDNTEITFKEISC
jgi:hypothetical protein